jgi:hypothetical protein
MGLEVGQARPSNSGDGPISPGDTGAYDVSADGQRFLIASASQAAEAPMTVIANWTALVNAR